MSANGERTSNGYTQTVIGSGSSPPHTRLSAAEVRRQLIAQQGYTHEELPTVQTITTKLNTLGYFPKKVAKSRPQKKSHKPMRSSIK